MGRLMQHLLSLSSEAGSPGGLVPSGIRRGSLFPGPPGIWRFAGFFDLKKCHWDLWLHLHT